MGRNCGKFKHSCIRAIGVIHNCGREDASTSQTHAARHPLDSTGLKVFQLSAARIFGISTTPFPSLETIASASIHGRHHRQGSLSTSLASKSFKQFVCESRYRGSKHHRNEIFLRLSILTITSPGARSDSIHAPRSGINDIKASWPGIQVPRQNRRLRTLQLIGQRLCSVPLIIKFPVSVIAGKSPVNLFFLNFARFPVYQPDRHTYGASLDQVRSLLRLIQTYGFPGST